MPQSPINSRYPASSRVMRWVGFFLLISVPLALIVLGAITQRRQRHFNYDEGRTHLSPGGALMLINVSAVTYRVSYGSYPPSLAAMGPSPPGVAPSCRVAGLVDDLTASGNKLGYVFEYIPGPPLDKHIAGCPVGAKNYVATARPLKYGETGRHSYYTDDSGCIWETTEDRSATRQDVCVGGCGDCRVFADR